MSPSKKITERDNIADAIIAIENTGEPLVAIAAHRRDQARGCNRFTVREIGVSGPAQDEAGKREDVDQRHFWHRSG
jgi:hypothetical protein